MPTSRKKTSRASTPAAAPARKVSRARKPAAKPSTAKSSTAKPSTAKQSAAKPPAAKRPAPTKATRTTSAPAAASSAPTPPVGVKPAKAAKPAKAKLVRDSFTMPHEDFSLIAKLKARALDGKRPAKKSELLRAGLRVLEGLSAAALVLALNKLTPIKPGRPKKQR